MIIFKRIKRKIRRKIRIIIRRTKKSRKIDFIIAGTQKGGTTALSYYLLQHPEIGMGNKKELHFFDNEIEFSRLKIDYSLYESFFDFDSQKKVYGEATPIYMYWEGSCRRIWEYNPNIKLVFILKNPIQRAFSQWNMEFERTVEKETFSYAIRNEKKRAKESLPLQNRIFSYVDRGYYSEQIRTFQRYFDDDQLMFIKYENFNTNQENVLIDVFNFIGVNPDNFKFNRKTINKREKHSELSLSDKVYLQNKFKHDVHQVEKLLNWDCSDWLE